MFWKFIESTCNICLVEFFSGQKRYQIFDDRKEGFFSSGPKIILPVFLLIFFIFFLVLARRFLRNCFKCFSLFLLTFHFVLPCQLFRFLLVFMFQPLHSTAFNSQLTLIIIIISIIAALSFLFSSTSCYLSLFLIPTHSLARHIFSAALSSSHHPIQACAGLFRSSFPSPTLPLKSGLCVFVLLAPRQHYWSALTSFTTTLSSSSSSFITSSFTCSQIS